MSRLITVGSGSSGNSYILECENETLLLELGVGWRDIKIALGFDLSNISGAIVSHVHGDHSKSIKDAIKAGIEVYSTKEVQSLYPKVKVPKYGQKTRIGGFVIQPLSVPHSCKCYAYIVQHEEFGKLVIATDCSSFMYKIKDVNHWLLEANYSEEILINNLCENELSRSLYENHLEIDNTIKALKANFCSSTQTIALIHLSNHNSDEQSFVQRVKDELGFSNVSAIKAGQVTFLAKDDF